jgi:hypothetical protein
MQIDMTTARNGRLRKPARSSIASYSRPSRASTDTTVNAPIVMKV